MERYNVREGIILKTFFCLDIVKHIIMRVQKRLNFFEVPGSRNIQWSGFRQFHSSTNGSWYFSNLISSIRKSDQSYRTLQAIC